MKRKTGAKIITYLLLFTMVLGIIGVQSVSTYADTEGFDSRETYSEGNGGSPSEVTEGTSDGDLRADGGEDGTVDGGNQGTGDGSDQGTGDGSDQGTGDGSDQGTGDGADQGTGDGTDQGTGDGTNQGTGDGADQGTGDGTDQGTGDGTDQDTDDESKDSTGDGSKESIGDGSKDGTGTGSKDSTGDGTESGSAQGKEKDTKDGSQDKTKSGDDSSDKEGKEKSSGEEKENKEGSWPAFSQKTKVDGVTIEVRAKEKVFPEGSTLSVSKVEEKDKVQAEINKAVEEKRDENKSNVANSYTFDIKILDKDRKEIQPADGQTVQVFFTTEEVADSSLDTQVYHIEENEGALKAEALEVSVSKDTAAVSTEGFSYYTVEFTYKDKQYVLQGGGVIKLSDLLSSLGIEGDVKGVSVSNRDLFNVLWGTEEGVTYIKVHEDGKTVSKPANDPKGSVRYVASFAPFSTQEWMDVLMQDGTRHHIVVTDAIQNNGQVVNIDGLAQGVDPTFTADIPIADYWIDESIVNYSVESRNAAIFFPGELITSGDHPGFFVYDAAADGNTQGHAAYDGNMFIEFDTEKEPLNGKVETKVTATGAEAVQSYNAFNGVLGRFKWENAAVGRNGELLDVWVEYSNPVITIETPTDATEPGKLENAYLSLLGGNMIAVGGQYKDGSYLDKRFGLEIAIKPYVTDKEGNVLTGSFYYPMTDIDVIRNDGSSTSGYNLLYGCNRELDNNEADKYRNFSETVVIKNGLVENSNGDKVYIPGAEGDKAYISRIMENNGEYTFSAGNTSASGSYKYADNTFYSGFLTLAENGSFSVTYRGAEGLRNHSGVNSNILCGTPGQYFNYRLRSSTQTLPNEKNPNPADTDGGNIYTTRECNPIVRREDGEIGPSVIATATGQTVTYTFFPEEDYGIRELWVWDDHKNDAGVIGYRFGDSSLSDERKRIYEWTDGAERYRWAGTDPSDPSVGEWHVFEYFNQVDEGTQKSSVWTDGTYTYEYGSTGGWRAYIHFNTMPSAERTNHEWLYDVQEGSAIKTYVYRWNNDTAEWHKYLAGDTTDLGVEDPPADAIDYEWGLKPPDSALADFGAQLPPDDAVNAFPSVETMRRGAGYRVFEGDGTNGTYESHDDDGDGKIDRYTYTFENINNNHAIHVVWGQTILEVKKQVTGNNVEPDIFTFHLKAWGPDPETGGTAYIDFSKAGEFSPELANRFFPVEGKEGVYRFELTNNTSVQIPPEMIPVGYEWEAWEVKADGVKYGTLDGWEIVGSDHKQGKFETEDASAHANFTNNRDKEIPKNQKLTVKKIWENDTTDIRPKNLNVTIVKPAAVSVDPQNFKTEMNKLVSGSSMTAIKYATKEEFDAVAESSKVQIPASNGSGRAYMWKKGTEVYFYSESPIYLSGSAAGMFSGCSNLTNISGLAELHTDFVTSFAEMFQGCKKLRDLSPLKDWNTANVTDMNKMFSAGNDISSSASTQMSLSDLTPLKNWKTQNVTSMRWMFRGGGYNLTDVGPLTGWDVSRVVNFQAMFFRTCVADTAGQLVAWDVGGVPASTVNNNTNPFYQMFTNSNSSQTTPGGNILPQWSNQPTSRTGSWNSGTYQTNVAARPSTTPTNMNDETEFWKQNQEESQVTKSYKVDPNDSNVWIYEFEVAPDGASWNIYETLPGNDGSYYTTSAGIPIPDDDTGHTGQSLKYVFDGVPYDTEAAAKAAAVATVKQDTATGKWIFNGEEFDTKEDAEAKAQAAVTQKYVINFMEGVGTKSNSVTGAKAGTTTTLKNTRRNCQLMIHKDTTEVALEYARLEAKSIYMNELADAETDPVRKQALLNGDESVLTDEEKEELKNRQDAACSFKFTLQLWYESESNPFNIPEDMLPIGVTKTGNGLYEFSLIPDPEATEVFTLPAGVRYKVVEEPSAGWHLTSYRNTQGLMNMEVKEAFFLNTRTNVINVVKKWGDDSYNGAVMKVRPVGESSLGIVVTTLDTGTRWQAAGNFIPVYNTDSEYFEPVESAFNGSTITPDVRSQGDVTVPYSVNSPRYVNLTAAIGTKIPAGDYVIDKVSDRYYKVIPVTNVPFEKEYTTADNFRQDDEAGTWLYQYSIPETERVIDVRESKVPGYYQKVETSIDSNGQIVYNIENTLDKRDLMIKKNTVNNEHGQFNFGIRFYVDTTTNRRYPVKFGHSQIQTVKDEYGNDRYEYELFFAEDITYNGKNIAGTHIMRSDGEFISMPLSNNLNDKLTEDEAAAILGVLTTIRVTGTDAEFPIQHSTGLTLNSLGLLWNGQDTESIYVEQNAEAVEHMTTNGRRMDWFIIPTPGHDEEISVRTPYVLRTEAETIDGVRYPKQLPDGVEGSEGSYYFSLRDGAGIIFNDLPVGVSYEIVEDKKEGWYLVSAVNDKGQLADDAEEKWIYQMTEYSSFAGAQAAAIDDITANADGTYSLTGIGFNTKEAAENAAKDAIIDNGDGTFTLNGTGYPTLEDAQTAAAGMVTGTDSPYFIDGVIFPAEKKAESAVEKAITKKQYEARKAVFTNEIEKGSLKIEKKTEDEEEGCFRFRARLYKTGEHTDIIRAEAWDESASAETEIIELMLAMSNAQISSQSAFFRGIDEYAADNGITTTKVADPPSSYIESGGIIDMVDGREVIAGTASYVEDQGLSIPDDFKDYLENFIQGNLKVYVFEEGVFLGGIAAENTAEKTEYLSSLLTDKGAVPVDKKDAGGLEGVYEFVLKNDGSIQFDEIPYGSRYEVWEELEDCWELVSINGNEVMTRADGLMDTAGTKTVTFLNARSKVDLTVSKEVKGSVGSKDKFFKFKIEIEGAGGQKTLHLDMSNAARVLPEGEDLQKAPNDATEYRWDVILNGKDSEGGNARDDDEGLTYNNASEYKKKNCEWIDSDGNTYKFSDDGMWVKTLPDGSEAEESTEPPADAVRSFADGQHINTDNEGKAVLYVYLHHGEKAVIKGLPAGSSYRISEVREGYQPSTEIKDGGDIMTGEYIDPDTGKIAEGSEIVRGDGKDAISDSYIHRDSEVVFTNSRDSVIPTEIFFGWWTWVILAGAGGAYAFWRFRKRRVIDGS